MLPQYLSQSDGALLPHRQAVFRAVMPAQAAMRSVPLGRPSLYTPEIAAEICSRIAAGESLRSVCRSDGMPCDATVRQWVLDDKHGFSAQYARARELLLEHWADELIEIADDSSGDTMVDDRGNARANNEWIQRSRLRSDNRKWLLSKLAPKKYGDRIEHVVRPGAPEQLSDAELAQIAKPVLAIGASVTNAPDIRTEIDEQDQ